LQIFNRPFIKNYTKNWDYINVICHRPCMSEQLISVPDFFFFGFPDELSHRIILSTLLHTWLNHHCCYEWIIFDILNTRVVILLHRFTLLFVPIRRLKKNFFSLPNTKTYIRLRRFWYYNITQWNKHFYFIGWNTGFSFHLKISLFQWLATGQWFSRVTLKKRKVNCSSITSSCTSFFKL
jgi:hypothetical protein